MTDTTDPLRGREVIIEMSRFGAYVRISAFDVASMTEITLQGPAGAPEAMLRQNALRRLAYVLKKNGVIA